MVSVAVSALTSVRIFCANSSSAAAGEGDLLLSAFVCCAGFEVWFLSSLVFWGECCEFGQLGFSLFAIGAS